MLWMPLALAVLMLPQAAPAPVTPPATPPDVQESRSGFWFRVEPGGAAITAYHKDKKGFRLDVAAQCGKDAVPVIGVIVRDDGPVSVTNARGLMAEVDLATGTLRCSNPDTDRGVLVTKAWSEADEAPFPVLVHRADKTFGFKTDAGACRFLDCEGHGQRCVVLETYPAGAVCEGTPAPKPAPAPAPTPKSPTPAFMASGFLLMSGHLVQHFPPEVPESFMLAANTIVRSDGRTFGPGLCTTLSAAEQARAVFTRAHLDGRTVVAELANGCALRVATEGTPSCSCSAR